jgi:hypothetical protein
MRPRPWVALLLPRRQPAERCPCCFTGPRLRAPQDAVERGWFTAECSLVRGRVDYGLALALAEQIADGMAFLHANNIVHGVRIGSWAMTPPTLTLHPPALPASGLRRCADALLARLRAALARRACAYARTNMLQSTAEFFYAHCSGEDKFGGPRAQDLTGGNVLLASAPEAAVGVCAKVAGARPPQGMGLPGHGIWPDTATCRLETMPRRPCMLSVRTSGAPHAPCM